MSWSGSPAAASVTSSRVKIVVLHCCPSSRAAASGDIALARQEGVEHQVTTESQTLGGEFEHAAQLTRGPEVGHHFGKYDQLIVPANTFHGHKDIALDDLYVD